MKRTQPDLSPPSAPQSRPEFAVQARHDVVPAQAPQARLVVKEVAREAPSLGQAAQQDKPAEQADNADQPPELVIRSFQLPLDESQPALRRIEYAIKALQQTPSTLKSFAFIHADLTRYALPAEIHNVKTGECAGIWLEDSDVADEDYEPLAVALKTNSSLEDLAVTPPLSKCNAMFQAIIDHPGLIEFECAVREDRPIGTGYVLPPEAAESLLKIMERLDAFELADAQFQEADFEKLVRTLSSNTRCVRLSFTNNMIGHDDLLRLLPCLERMPALENLTFKDQLFDTETYRSLGQFLASKPTLTQLDLTYGWMSEKELQALSAGLAKHGNMRWLSIDLKFKKPFQDAVIRDFLSALHFNPNLKCVEIGMMLVNLRGATRIKNFLETSKSAMSVDLTILPDDGSGDLEQVPRLKARLEFLYTVLVKLEALQSNAAACLALCLRVREPTIAADLFTLLVENLAIVPNGKDAMVSLAKMIGYDVTAKEDEQSTESDEDSGSHSHSDSDVDPDRDATGPVTLAALTAALDRLFPQTDPMAKRPPDDI